MSETEHLDDDTEMEVGEISEHDELRDALVDALMDEQTTVATTDDEEE